MPCSHYPSWGSETPQLKQISMLLDGPSLPLMGIGNEPGVSASPPVRADSLPLMGIGNGRRAQDCPRRESALITPHGDRKPLSLSTRRSPGWGGSLPLMGIGNGSSPNAVETKRTISLPLMGIGNLDGRAEGW